MMIKGYYFGKCEQKHKRGQAMIIMDIKIDNFYCFKNFQLNMSYPKKIVDSTIQYEYLEDRPNFRYKKVNILMGGNATGKTSLGKMLMMFANYFDNENFRMFTKVINNRSKPASLTVDFVTHENILYRFYLCISLARDDKFANEVNMDLWATDIGMRDSYESCAKRIENGEGRYVEVDEIDTNGWYFSYPADMCKNKTYDAIEDDLRYVSILERILKTLDPSIEKVVKMEEVDNAYAIKIEDRSVIIQDGKILDTEVLSSGTKAGLDISYIIASLVGDIHDLYYCDELFSYVNSDIEKACLSIIIEKLTGRKQLFFTTHNTDILDMQLPKHSFTFLKKDVRNVDRPIQCINAGDYLKRNTDCLKNAVENDLFSTMPELEQLYEITKL